MYTVFFNSRVELDKCNPILYLHRLQAFCTRGCVRCCCSDCLKVCLSTAFVTPHGSLDTASGATIDVPDAGAKLASAYLDTAGLGCGLLLQALRLEYLLLV